MKQLKYRRKVNCKNCGISQDLEFDYKEKISSAMCPLCGCETLVLEDKENEMNEYAIEILNEKVEDLKIDSNKWYNLKNKQQIEIHKNLISQLQQAIEILFNLCHVATVQKDKSIVVIKSELKEDTKLYSILQIDK